MHFSTSLKIDVNQFRLEFIYRAGSSPSGAIAYAVEAPVGAAVRIILHQQRVSGEVSLLALYQSSWNV